MTLRTERPDVGDQPVTLDTTGETSPYPYFEYMRRTDPVFHGSLMDHELMPPELKPEDEWVLFGYDGVFQAFRDDKIFTSAAYDKTIGLVMGHMILAMGGKEHHDHRSLVAKAFRATALERWEPSVIGPVCDQLIDEIKNDGHADLVKALTFEFPTRIISELLGLPREDLDLFRRLSLDIISIPTDIMAGLTAANELHGYFLDQVEQRRRKLTNDIIGDLVAAEIDGEKLTDEAIIAFLRLLLPAGLETTYRSSGNLLYLLLTHPEQLAMVQQDRSLIPAAIEEGLRYETPLVMVMRTTTEEVRGERPHHPGQRAGRFVYGVGQPRREPVERRQHLRHPPASPSAHLVRRGDPHVSRNAFGPDGNPGDAEQPVGPGPGLGSDSR